MARLTIFQRLDKKDATENYEMLKGWFANHKRRKFCKTDLFVVRRGSIAADILRHCMPGVTLEGMTAE